MLLAGVVLVLVGCGGPADDLSQLPLLTEDPLGARDLLGMELIYEFEQGYAMRAKPQYTEVIRRFSVGDRDPQAAFDEVVALARDSGWEGGEPDVSDEDHSMYWSGDKTLPDRGCSVRLAFDPSPKISVRLTVSAPPGWGCSEREGPDCP